MLLRGQVQTRTSGQVAVESGLGAIAGEWRELAERVGASPFLTPGWFEAWLGSFGAGDAEVWTHRREGRLTGVLPLLRRRATVRAPANFHSPVFGPVAADQDAVSDIAHAVTETAGRGLHLEYLDPAGPLAAAVYFTGKAWRRLVHTDRRPSAPWIELTGTAEEYLAARPKKVRSEIGRCRRRLAEQGTVGFEVVQDVTPGTGPWQEFLRLEGSGWKSENGTAISSQPDVERFYAAVCSWASREGTLRLLSTSVGGRAIAADLGIESHGVLHLLKGGIDPDHARFSPGTLNLAEAVSYAYSRGLNGIDLGPGESGYKERWATGARERITIRTFARGPLGLASWLANEYGRPLARRALRHPVSSPATLPEDRRAVARA